MRILRKIRGYRREDYSFFIFGLGNPGSTYADTLHNAGFMVLDLLASREGMQFSMKRGSAVCCPFHAAGHENALFVKPMTYMNLSGEAVGFFAKKYRFPIESLIIVHDDLDISPGRVKIKKGGGSGGHRGVESISAVLGTTEFGRIKIGVGRPPPGVDSVEYLLSPPPAEIRDDICSGVGHGADAIMMTLKEGMDRAVTYYNSGRPYEKS